jgi:CHAT domain-containing protein
MKQTLTVAGLIGPLVVALLCLCAVAGQAQTLSGVGQEVDLGANLNGEDCRLRQTETPDKKPGKQDYAIFCEGWTLPSGFLVAFNAPGRFNPAELLTKGNYADQLTVRLAECSAPTPAKIVDRLDGAVRFCRRRDGGWPVVVGSTSSGGRGYLFEMLPTNVPLAERAIDALATNKAVVIKPAPRTALILQFEAAVKISASQFGVGDLGAVRQLSTLGDEAVWATRFVESERAWTKVLDIMQRVFGADHPDNGHAMINLALAIYRQGKISEADEMLKRAEPFVKHSRRPDDYPEWLTFRSYIAESTGHTDVALALAEEALTRRRAIFQTASGLTGPLGLGVKSLYAAAIGHSDLVLARAYNGLGRFKDAVAACQEGIKNYVLAYGETHPMIGWTYYELAVANRGNGDLPDARDAAAKALAMHEYLYGDNGPVFLDAVLAGRVAVQEQRNQDALAYFQRAIKAAQMSSDIPVVPADWLAEYLDLLSAGSGGPADAFSAAQLARGGVTAEAIRAMAARAAADNPDIAGVVRSLQDAQAEVANLRAQVANQMQLNPRDRKPQDAQLLQDQLKQAEANAASAEERLQAQFPRYAGLVRPNQVSADEVSRLLRPGEALLLAVTAPSSTYLLLVRDGQVHVNKAALTSAELTQRITAMRQTLYLSDAGLLRPFDVADARQLYDTLLAPLAENLSGLHHLIFVSNGPLLSLPLGLLVRPSTSPDAPPAYLQRDIAISVVPTVATFRNLRQAPAVATAPQPFLGFGDPDFSGAPGDLHGLVTLTKQCRADAAVQLGEIHDLPSLPETETELRSIAAALHASADSVVLGADATKANLLGRDLSQYRVLAFSTHGLLANQLDCQDEPALVLSLPAGATQGSDALLTASEVASLHLDTDWVLLSACNTAGPEGLTGEALSGLTRSFFYAGGRSVMATHWPVESEATVRLTTLTFDNYAKEPRFGKAEALRKAQLALMDDPKTAHPIFWAPFVLVGDGGGTQSQ